GAKRTVEATAERKARISDTLNLCTRTDCAGERKTCLAAHEVYVALIVRHRDRGATIAHVTDDAPAFAHSLHVRIPELAHRDFLRRRRRHQAESTIHRQLQRDRSLP